MGIKIKAQAFGKKFKLDSHHAIERFGLFFGLLSIVGLLVLTTSGFTAVVSNRDTISSTALWTPQFTTSKTELAGTVDGVYTNTTANKALVLMHFDTSAKISYNAADYAAFLLGSNAKLGTEKLTTPGVKATMQVFGATGYMGVLLEADQPFDQQVLNLTMRAKAELSFKEQQESGESADELAGDSTFDKYDQWRVFFNPGATNTTKLEALDAANFDAARVFYDLVLKTDEDAVRTQLDTKLIELRANLAQIAAYDRDLATTKVDGLFLRPPAVPAIIGADAISGSSASESKDNTSTLQLETSTVVSGGFDFDWRDGNIYDGYLKKLVPAGSSYVNYLRGKSEESSTTDATKDTNTVSIQSMKWILSDGTNLVDDYSSTDTAMRPLTNVMNNLSQAYQDYYSNKTAYQIGLLGDLLDLEVDLIDVRSNSSVRSDDAFLVTYY